MSLKEQLALENLANIAPQDIRLAEAIKGSGTKNPNFSIGSGTVAEADQLGKTWVGDGAKLTSDGSGWISADGTRVYRTPVVKSSEFATTGIQANFELYRINPVTGVKEKVSNGHLNVKKNSDEGSIKRLTSDEVNAENYMPDSSECLNVKLLAKIGPYGPEGSDYFEFYVCTAAWIKLNGAFPWWGRNHLVINVFDIMEIRKAIELLLENCEAENWGDLAKNLSTYMAWEYSGYKS